MNVSLTLVKKVETELTNKYYSFKYMKLTLLASCNLKKANLKRLWVYIFSETTGKYYTKSYISNIIARMTFENTESMILEEGHVKYMRPSVGDV